MTIAACQFWRSTGDEMAGRGFDFGPDRWNIAFTVEATVPVRRLVTRSLRNNALNTGRDRLIRPTRVGRSLADIGKRNRALIDSITSVAGKPILVDASKDPMRARALREFAGISPVIIHLVRDAPGFVSSNMKNAGASLDKSIYAWNALQSDAARLRRTIPMDQWLTVKYEDLATNPQREGERIIRALGLEGTVSPRFRDERHHILGNRMRLSDSSEIRLDEKWRERLSEHDVIRILAKTSRHRAAVGYSDS